MRDKNKKIKKRYNRISRVYDFFDKPMEAMVKKWRKALVEKIEGGKLLEVGVGTGKSLDYYPETLDITGIDFSTSMLKKARKKAGGKSNIHLMEMDAQAMTFEDNTFDTVITSCVFCSVPDPVQGLKEIRRVTKNGGKIIMLEHMRSEGKVMGKIMDITNFIPLHIWGANINRRTLKNLEKAGFNEEDIEYQDIWSDIVKFIEIRNNK